MRDVIGQRRLLERVGARAVRGDVAHAYLLSGPRSIGKRTIALRLAQTLNCAGEASGPGGCGACLACRKIQAGIHPDVVLIERDPQIKVITIEQMREMQLDLSLRPLEGRSRIVIVDDASELHDHAQDALLKTLEEPPRHAVLLLLTRMPERLHETVVSRAQALPFRLVPTAEIAAGLAARFGPEQARHAAAAGGRPGLGISLASDGAIRARRDALDEELYRLVSSGLTDRFAWAARLADDDKPRRREAAIGERLSHWTELLRDAALAAQGVEGRALRPDRAAPTARLAATVAARDLVDAALLLEKLRGDLVSNANARAMLEIVALRLPYSETVAGAAA